MSISVQCPRCRARFAVKDHFAGKLIHCPGCKADITVRRSSAASKAEPMPDQDDEEELVDEAEEQAKPAKVESPESEAEKAARRRTILISLGVTGFVLFWVCAGGLAYWESSSKAAAKNAIAYNHNLANSFQRVDKPRTAMINQVAGCLENGVRPGDVGYLRAQHREMQSALRAVRDEIAGWQVPPNGHKLHASYEQFLDAEQQAMPRFARLISIIEDVNLSPKQKQDECIRVSETIEKDEQPRLAELQKLQKEFAREYGIILIPPASPPYIGRLPDFMFQK